MVTGWTTDRGKRRVHSGVTRRTIWAALTTVTALALSASPASAAPGSPPAPDVISTIVGGVEGPAPATDVAINPCSVKSAGAQLYVADLYNGGVIRAVNEQTGHLTTPAGVGVAGFYGDRHPATAAELNQPCSAATDQAGNLIIADTDNNRVRVVAASTGTFYGQAMDKGDVYTVAGPGSATGTCAFDDGPTFCPVDAEPDHAGNLVVADTGEADEITKPALVRVVAGSTGRFYGRKMTVGDMYIVAGGNAGFSGDGGPAVRAGLGTEIGPVRVDAAGNLVIADSGTDRIRVVAVASGTFYGQAMTAGDIYTVAGDGAQAYSGDGGPAIDAGIAVAGVAVDSSGNLVIGDGFNGRVRVVAVTTGTFYGQAMKAGDIYTVAGNGKYGFSGDGGPAIKAAFRIPGAVAVDSSGNLVAADTSNFRIRVVAARTGTFYGQAMKAGDIYTVAGNGNSGFSGNGGPPTTASLAYPSGVAADPAGDIVIIDQGNQRVQFVAAKAGTFYGQAVQKGDIYTVAGHGIQGFSGDGGPATLAKLSLGGGIDDVAFDAAGNVVLVDAFNMRVRVVAATTGTFYGQAMTEGDIYNVAGNGKVGTSGVGGPATKAEFDFPVGLAVDHAGNLIVTSFDLVQAVAARTGTFYGQAMKAGRIYTIAGNGTEGFSGDGGPATEAELDLPSGVAVDQAGNVLIPDNDRVRVVAATTGTFYGQAMTKGDIYTVAGPGTALVLGDGGPATAGWLGEFGQVAVDGAGNLIIADTEAYRIRVVAAATGTFYGQAMTKGDIYTVAGTGKRNSGIAFFSGDGGPAAKAGLNTVGVAVDPADGDLLVADFPDHRVRSIGLPGQ